MRIFQKNEITLFHDSYANERDRDFSEKLVSG